MNSKRNKKNKNSEPQMGVKPRTFQGLFGQTNHWVIGAWWSRSYSRLLWVVHVLPQLQGYISGGRQGGLKLPPPVPFTPASRPLPKWLPPLCSIVIVKCYTILQNFSPFLPVPATLGIPLPAHSPPTSHTSPAPYSPGLPPPCPPPHVISKG